ncbi:hypothetical protein BHM03_00024548 [Ensete ventricosum]|nr:hypothetical protein BHM03_00024548 [Ensete ventricosum]
MVPKTKGASRHMHLISEKHLMEELRRPNWLRRCWDHKALAQGKRTQRWVLLKNMLQCYHSSYHEESGLCTTDGDFECKYQTVPWRGLDHTKNRIGTSLQQDGGGYVWELQSVFPTTKGSCLENIKVLKQEVERGEEATTSPEGLSYPKSKHWLERRWTRRSVTVP